MNLNEIYAKIDKKILAEAVRMGDKIPYIPIDGVYPDMRDKNMSFWTNGFWSGMLWQMYHSSQNEQYKEAAKKSEIVFDEALRQFEGLHHDVGFQFLHTAVASGNYIRAWNVDNTGRWGKDLTGWMIVDCLMKRVF